MPVRSACGNALTEHLFWLKPSSRVKPVLRGVVLSMNHKGEFIHDGAGF